MTARVSTLPSNSPSRVDQDSPSQQEMRLSQAKISPTRYSKTSPAQSVPSSVKASACTGHSVPAPPPTKFAHPTWRHYAPRHHRLRRNHPLHTDCPGIDYQCPYPTIDPFTQSGPSGPIGGTAPLCDAIHRFPPHLFESSAGIEIPIIIHHQSLNMTRLWIDAI